MQPEEYERLRRQSRRDAVWLGADPSVGEDALNTVLESVLKGNDRPLESAKYFRTYVISRIRDRNRIDRRTFASSPTGTPDAELDARREEELRRILPRLLQALDEEERGAVCAQVRGWLADRECSEEEVRAFERHWGIELGIHNGTGQLALNSEKNANTVASWAHRGMKKMNKLAKLLRRSARGAK